MTEQPPLDDGERAELERLRAEARERPERIPAAEPAGGRGRMRGFASAVVILIGCLLAPLSVVSTWLDAEVSNTDAYVETVAPLIDDPALQEALATTVTTEVFSYLDVEGLTRQALTALADRTDLPPALQQRVEGLAVPMVNGVQGYVERQVQEVVASDRFATAWAEANRVAHEQLVAVLTGDTREGVEIEDGKVTISIAPFVELAKQRLVDRGFDVAARIPTVNKTFLLFELENLSTAQNAFAVLQAAGRWLPFITLLVLAAGVLLAKSRRRALVGAGIGVAVAMIVLGVGIMIGRAAYLSAVPTDLLPRDAAAQAFDTMVRFLRSSVRAGFLLGIVVAIAAYLTGPAPAAVATRRGVGHGVAGIRSAVGRPEGAAGGQVATTLGTYRTVLRVATLTIAGLVILFWDRPGPAVVITVAVLAAVVLIVLEVLSAPPKPAAAPEP
jgi:hypothetical protein